jgi:hypothetical protein
MEAKEKEQQLTNQVNKYKKKLLELQVQDQTASTK